MDPATGALIIAGAFNLLLSALILLHAPKTSANVSYAVLAGFLVLWITAILVLRLSIDNRTEVLALATSYLAGAGIAAAFWYFVVCFTGRGLSRIRGGAVIIAGAVIAALAFVSPAFIRGVARARSGALTLDLGPAHLFFVLYFSVVMLIAFAHLYRFQRRAEPGAPRRAAALLFAGTLVTTIIGSFFNIVLVQVGDAEFIAWGPVSTMIMVTFIGYAIIRHHLLETRIIAAELFTIGLLSILFINLVFTPTSLGRLLTGTTFAFGIGFGMLLIRSAWREAEVRERLASANQELQRLDRAKSDFISLASHQLRTPLTIIRGYTASLMDGSLGIVPEAAKTALGKVFASTTQLASLVSDLLDLSRIETGQLQYSFQPLHLEPLITHVIDELEPLARERSITLTVAKEKLGDDTVLADAGKLHEVFTNLIDNAVQYSTGGAVTIGLRECRLAERPGIRISVADQGIGINPSDVPHLFTRFTRAENAKTMRPDGTGLGLYLVKRLVDDHHGRVWAESPGIGHGSTFVVELPAAGTGA